MIFFSIETAGSKYTSRSPAPGARRVSYTPSCCPEFVSKSAPALPGPFKRFEQEEDFGDHRVVQIPSVGGGAVAAAGDDCLEGVDESANITRQVGFGCQFCEKRRGDSRFASEERLGHGKADAASVVVILAAIA
jgi:hypothetical protein